MTENEEPMIVFNYPMNLCGFNAGVISEGLFHLSQKLKHRGILRFIGRIMLFWRWKRS